MTKLDLEDLNTGTPHGISYWRDLAYGCATRARLGKEGRSEARSNPDWADESTGYGTLATMTGSVYHALRAQYATGEKFDCADFLGEVGQDIEWIAKAVVAATGLFRWFRGTYPHDLWGEAISIEEIIESSEEIRKATGLPEYTCRPDLVTRVRARDVKRLTSEFPGLKGMRPGYYLIDYKTCARLDDLTISRYAHNLQFITYEAAWNAAHPDQILEGKIAELIHKVRVPELRPVLIPKGDVLDKKILRALADRIALVHANPILQVPNPERCWDYNRECTHLYSKCARSAL